MPYRRTPFRLAAALVLAIAGPPASFAGTGKVITSMGPYSEEARSLAVDADGRIIVAGFGSDGSYEDLGLVRYHVDGVIDPTFGDDGKVLTPVGTTDAIANSTALQADGKIVVAGYSFDGSDADFTVARYLPDGSPDPSFGGTGIVRTSIGTSVATHDVAAAVAVQADGKIVVAGTSGGGASNAFALMRYQPDGTLDASFGSGGKVTTTIGTASATALSMAIQADGKIVAAGSAGNDTNADFALARYATDGTLDASFGDGGTVTTSLGSSDDAALSVAVQADGKIVAAGFSIVDHEAMALVRYDVDGTLDPSFGAGGTVVAAIGMQYAVAWSVAIQIDGTIVVAGASDDDFALLRYASDGSLDGTFGNAGVVVTPVGAGIDRAHAVAVQTDGRIVAAGQAVVDGWSDFAVVRYLADGSLDASFGPLACAPRPVPSCVEGWGKGSLRVKEDVAGKEKLHVKLLQGPPLTPADLGDPLTPGGTAYTLCLYEDADELAGELHIERAGDVCGGRACWRAAADGYRYQDRTAATDGVRAIDLRGGSERSRILLTGANDAAKGHTTLPTGIAAALAASNHATVQLFASHASACFSATLRSVTRNDGAVFQARE